MFSRKKATRNTVPSKEEKKKIYKRNTFLFFTFVLTTVYLSWRVFFTLPFNEGIAQVIYGILLLGAEIVTCFTTLELFYRKFTSTNYILPVPSVDHQHYPHVDVFIATHNEPLDILYKTANACTFMDYPDKNKVHIYFCDDGNRPTVADLAAELGIGYLGLANNKHAKSGNLNNALAKTNSPLIATFDADMIPQRTFLMKTVPYFFLPTFIEENGQWRKRTPEELDESYKIGLIQTPQSFYNADLFQFNLYSEDSIPNEQDFFSREVNVMRNSSNAIAYTGSNTLIARQAMVDIGGFPIHTITEDFETSIRIQKEHYITYATSEVQAAGLTTTDFKSMLKQRKRWAQGVIQSLQNTKAIFTRKLSWAGRITYLSSYLYWWSFLNRIIFILAPILFALFDFRTVKCTLPQLLVFWLPFYLFYSLSFRYLSSNVRSNRWSQIIDTIFSPYLISCVVLESFGIHERKFKVTSKEKKERSDMIYAVPHLILLALSILAFFHFIFGKYGWALISSSIILFWLCYNMISLVYAIFFMAGRKAYRKFDRIHASEAVKIYYGNTILDATTVDLSDEGMLFCHEKPIYIPDDAPFKLVVRTPHYQSELHAKLVYVKERDNKWFYAASVTPVDAKSKRHYYQIIYDRNHSLPKTMDAWSTISDDIRRNIERRVLKTLQPLRKQTRFDIQKQVQFEDGACGFVHDFNYKYFSISAFSDTNEDPDFIYRVVCSDGTTLELQRTPLSAGAHSATLFKLLNLQALIEKGVNFDKLIEEMKGC